MRIAVQLCLRVWQLFQEVYLYLFSSRLCSILRFALGVPFLIGMLFLLQMRKWYFPEVGTGLDTSCVRSLPLCYATEEAVAHTVLLQRHYQRLAEARREQRKPRQPSTKAADNADVASPQSLLLQPLTHEEENDLLGAIFVLIRSIETQIVDTAEECELITPYADLVKIATPPTKASQPSPPPGASAVHVYSCHASGVRGHVTTAPHVAVSAGATVVEVIAAASMSNTTTVSAAIAAAPAAVLISPVEYIFRVIRAISIAEGWADITEHTRVLFQELVRNRTPPMQSCIVYAVGELCSLLYELESGQVGAITPDQRKRIAAAIDAFRSEKSVGERCTIGHKITILPLPDFDHTTRCLGLICRSPCRKSQLILCSVGSNSRRNWLTNFHYWPVPLPERYGVVEALLLGGRGGALRVAHPQVRRGFLGLVQTIPTGRSRQTPTNVLFVRHSLGGALAQLAGLELAAEWPSRRITVTTMASPHVLAVDWSLRMARQHAWGRQPMAPAAVPHKRAAVASPPSTPQLGEVHDHDALAGMLTMPSNYRRFRGLLQPDVVSHLPPKFLHFTHSGQRIPLSTGCTTSLSFMLWGMYSKLYHSASLYRSVLKQPIVSQTHWYTADRGGGAGRRRGVRAAAAS
jgi:hypothetical protein